MLYHTLLCNLVGAKFKNTDNYYANKSICIDISKSLRDAALSLNESGKGIVIITESNHFSGIVTDGDLEEAYLVGFL